MVGSAVSLDSAGRVCPADPVSRHGWASPADPLIWRAQLSPVIPADPVDAIDVVRFGKPGEWGRPGGFGEPGLRRSADSVSPTDSTGPAVPWFRPGRVIPAGRNPAGLPNPAGRLIPAWHA